MDRPVPPFDRDKLYMIPRLDAARSAFLSLTRIQELPAHEMVAGVAILFAAVCNRVGLDPEDLHALASKLLRPTDFDRTTNDTLQSLRDFAGIHIKGERDVPIM